jgi:phosphoketolase
MVDWLAGRNVSVRRIRPHAEGRVLRRAIRLPNIRSWAVDVAQAGRVLYEHTRPLGGFLRDAMRDNMSTFCRGAAVVFS